MFKWKRRRFPRLRWLRDVRLTEEDVEQLGEVVKEIAGTSTKAKIFRSILLAAFAAYSASPDEAKATQAPPAYVRPWQ
ncbi:hypothetical protein [Burkholderia phage vB_BglM_WTB]